MAVPTITSVSSSQAVAGMLIRVNGTNFAVQPQNTAQLFHQTVLVTLGGVECAATCYDSTLLTFLVPDLSPGIIQNGALVPAAAYALSVQNLDLSGNAIAGELVTRASAVSISMPNFTSEYETDLVRMIRSLMRLLKRQLLINVDFAVQADYDATTGDSVHLAQFASVPAAALVGPELVENRFYSINEQPDFPTTGDTQADFVETKVPYTVDAKFDIVFASDNKVELLNLMAGSIAVFHKNKYLFVDRDPSNPSLGQTKYELDFAENGQPKKIGGSNNSSIQTFVCSIVIRGFDISSLQGLDIGRTSGVDNQSIVGIVNSNNETVLAPAKQGV